MKLFEKAKHIRKHVLRMSLTDFHKRLMDIFAQDAPTYETLCRFENGHHDGIRTKTLNMIAVGLGMTIKKLIEATDNLAIEPDNTYTYNEDAIGRIITPPQSRFLTIILDIKPGGFTRDEEDASDKYEKLLIVVKGEIIVYIDSDKHFVKNGGSIYFASSVKHHFENPSKKVRARCIIVRNPKA